MLIRNLSKKVEKVNVLSPPSGHVSRVLSLCSKFGHVDSKCPKHPPIVVQWTSNPLKIIQCIKNYYFGLLDQGNSLIGSKIRPFFAYIGINANTLLYSICAKNGLIAQNTHQMWSNELLTPSKGSSTSKSWCWPFKSRKLTNSEQNYTILSHMRHICNMRKSIHAKNGLILPPIGQFPWSKRTKHQFLIHWIILRGLEVHWTTFAGCFGKLDCFSHLRHICVYAVYAKNSLILLPMGEIPWSKRPK